MRHGTEEEQDAVAAAAALSVWTSLTTMGLCNCPACVASSLGQAIVDIGEMVAGKEGIAKGMELIRAVAADLAATEPKTANGNAPSTGTFQ